MKLQTFITPLAILFLALAILVFALLRGPAMTSYGASLGLDTLGVATTSTAVIVTTSTRILATTTSPTDPTNNYQRLWASICNYTNTPVYLRLDNDKPVTGTTTALVVIQATTTEAVSSCFTIGDKFIYHGSVQASSTNQTGVSVQVTQYVRQ